MGYDDQTEKSNACGLKSLPQGKELASGFVVIAEFGTYFIHELCKKHKALRNYDDFINSSLLEKHVNFVGIKVENYFVIPPMGPNY